MEISTEGLTRAEVLVALYSESCQQGLGFLQDAAPLSLQDAEKLLEDGDDFDYLRGKVMKVVIPEEGGDIRVDLYDRDNGTNAAAHALDTARGGGLRVVPATCSLNPMIREAISALEFPCDRCNLDREVCKGFPRSGRL